MYIRVLFGFIRGYLAHRKPAGRNLRSGAPQETRESKERMMAPFLDVLDLKGDPDSWWHREHLLVS